MRYAIISDIHSNLEALEAALGFLADEKIEKYVCAGDLVGYAADPQGCVRLIKSLSPAVSIAGNHDWGVLGLLNLENFNEYAKEAVRWTARILEKDDLDYLRSLDLIAQTDDFTVVHGSLVRPEEFDYILAKSDALKTIAVMSRPVCFVGHSHVAGIFYSDGADIKYTKGPKVKIDRDRKYIVNVGSIGQPRDSDPRASIAVYDSFEDTVEIKRVKYDVKKAQEKIIAAGLPSYLASRLAFGR